MRPFEYRAPATLDEALALLGAGARPLVGGTDLVTLMKPELVTPERLVSVRKLLPDRIVFDAQGVTLGAAATLADLERDSQIAQRYTALSQAARVAASAQLRNAATLGGNLLQRPRCWYFRHPQVHCWLKGGSECFAREGENQRHALFHPSACVAVHPSDVAPALEAFDAALKVRGPGGERVVPLAKFFAPPTDERRTESTLADDELIVEASLPSHPEETRSVYLKAMDRGLFAFALVSVAAVLRLSSERHVGHARIVLGGVAPIPWRAEAAERALLGAAISDRVLDEAAQAAVHDASPLAQNGYKVPLVKALVRQALESLSR